MRSADITRKTAETDISLSLSIDGTGEGSIDTGCGFLNHMLTLFAKHGRFDLNIRCKGDTDVDYHHTTEDIGIALAQAFRAALGDGRGIRRYGSMLLPMDETLMLVSLDISGRAFLRYDAHISAAKVGDFDCELAEEFLMALSRTLGLTLHVQQFAGSNAHHIIEAIFKALGRSLGQACSIDEAAANVIPSSKGVLL